MKPERLGPKTQIAIVGGAFAVLLLAVFAEEAAAAGQSLFQQIAGSYLTMFIDRLSFTYLCF